jgi:tetratricopeptide (TPR) repeat protein
MAFGQTIDELRKAAVAGDAKAQCQLGEKYLFGEDIAEDDAQALQWYLKSANQGYVDAQSALGQMYQLGIGVKEDETQAIFWLDKAIKQGNTDAITAESLIYSGHGDEYANKGNYDKAISEYTKAINLDKSGTVYLSRGIAYMNNNNYTKALADFTTLISLEPNDSGNVHIYCGMVYDKQKQYDKAISEYSKTIEVLPNDKKWTPLAYNGRGWVYYEQGNYDKAITDATKSIELNKTNCQAYDTRACAYLKQGKINDAIHDYGSIVSLTAADKNFSSDLVEQNFAGISTKGIPLVAGAATYMEMQVNKYLGKGDPARYATMLKFIEDKSGVTQADITNYVKAGISTAVDEQFNKVAFRLDYHNATLSRDSDTGKYTLSYGGVNTNNEIRTITANLLEALSSEMRNGKNKADFTAKDLGTVRAQVANIPAVVLAATGTTNGVLDTLKTTLTGFYTSPTSANYNTVKGIYTLFCKREKDYFGDRFFSTIRGTYENVLSALSDPLAQKVFADSNAAGSVAANLPALNTALQIVSQRKR